MRDGNTSRAKILTNRRRSERFPHRTALRAHDLAYSAWLVHFCVDVGLLPDVHFPWRVATFCCVLPGHGVSLRDTDNCVMVSAKSLTAKARNRRLLALLVQYEGCFVEV